VNQQSHRRILDEEWWPDHLVVTTVEQLLQVYGCASLAELEDHLAGALPEDPGDIHIIVEDEGITISSFNVAMWTLPFPVSATAFDDYLFELDERTTLGKALSQIPDVETWTDAGCPSIIEAMAELLGSTPEEVAQALGEGWRPLDLDWVGHASNPSLYLWTGTSVLALDDANAYLFGPSRSSSTGFELDGENFEEAGWLEEIWQQGRLTLDTLTAFLQGRAEAEPDACPACGSRDVVHVVFGLPADPDLLPSWVRLGGCVVDGTPHDRHCEACGHAWTAPRS
jgi:hypothetical protein